MQRGRGLGDGARVAWGTALLREATAWSGFGQVTDVEDKGQKRHGKAALGENG